MKTSQPISDIKLTAYSHGAGCGCKLSPETLNQILHNHGDSYRTPSLLVGNQYRDDAAVYDLMDDTHALSTVDFFTPIVDDPFTYGSIAAANALSDIYAMGGNPLMAIAILGWPVDKIPAHVAGKVMEGAHAACKHAHIPIAGGHSIDTTEPIFGLAVTGRVSRERLRCNHFGRAGSALYLTKPLGVGIVTTAHKKNNLQSDEHMQIAVKSMLTLNKFGAELGAFLYVNAMTDVTGFGLLGHLIELCEASKVSAEIVFDDVPVFDFLETYLKPENIPGGTHRNWLSYSSKVANCSEAQKNILADPQTSGGLLVAVDADYAKQFEQVAARRHMSLKPFGKLVPQQDVPVKII